MNFAVILPPIFNSRRQQSRKITDIMFHNICRNNKKRNNQESIAVDLQKTTREIGVSRNDAGRIKN